MNHLNIFVLGIALLIIQTVTATNWYIDAVHGKDSHNGNKPNRALQSLSKVNALVLEPGDSLFFKAGTSYDGQLKLHGSGDAESPVFVGTYGCSANEDKPVINAHGLFEAALHLYNYGFFLLWKGYQHGIQRQRLYREHFGHTGSK